MLLINNKSNTRLSLPKYQRCWNGRSADQNKSYQPTRSNKVRIISILLSPVLVSLTTLGLYYLQLFLSTQDEDALPRPYGIGYLVPIVILTAIGGRFAGFISLLLSIAFSIYFLIPPVFSWHIQYQRDYIELAMLTIVSSIVVFAVQALQNNAVLLNRIRISDQLRQQFIHDVLVNVTNGRLHLCNSREMLPPQYTPYCDPIEITEDTLSNMRHIVETAAKECGFAREKVFDIITATGESSMNAIVHAGGGTGRIFTSTNCIVQVWIEDKGGGISMDQLPRATLEKGYTTAGSMGYGFKMILQTVDSVWLLTGSTGTTVVLEQNRSTRHSEWWDDH